jgi:hypothetical protein
MPRLGLNGFDQPVEHSPDPIDAILKYGTFGLRAEREPHGELQLHIHFSLRSQCHLEMMAKRLAPLSACTLADVRGNGNSGTAKLGQPTTNHQPATYRRA